jgi:hypothetical protein
MHTPADAKVCTGMHYMALPLVLHDIAAKACSRLAVRRSTASYVASSESTAYAVRK